MKVKYVEGVSWSGGPLSTYVILENGPLGEQSIVPAPTLYLVHLAQGGQRPNSIRSSTMTFEAFSRYSKRTDRIGGTSPTTTCLAIYTGI